MFSKFWEINRRAVINYKLLSKIGRVIETRLEVAEYVHKLRGRILAAVFNQKQLEAIFDFS